MAEKQYRAVPPEEWSPGDYCTGRPGLGQVHRFKEVHGVARDFVTALCGASEYRYTMYPPSLIGPGSEPTPVAMTTVTRGVSEDIRFAVCGRCERVWQSKKWRKARGEV